MFNVSGYSQENLKKFQKVIQIALDEYEILQKPNVHGIVISPERLRNIGIDKYEFLSILHKVNSDGINVFNILNDYPDSSKMGFKDNIVFKVRSNSLDDLKKLLQLFDSKITTSSITANPQSTKSIPIYDTNKCEFIFMNKTISIPPNTNQDALCKVILKNRSSLGKKWSWDEVVEKWGDDPEGSKKHKVYSAAREINDKVAIETGFKGFFITTLSTTQVNPEII